MALLKVYKVIASLPATLQPDAIYLVRVGAGFDMYVTDTTGAIAYASNGGSGGGGDTLVSEGALIDSATSKTTPADADQLGLMDSAASNILKKLSWANLKATLKTYFDTLYQPVGSIGIRGVHTLYPLSSGDATSALMTMAGFSSSAMINGRLWCYPYFPANTVVSSSLYINVQTLAAGSFCRILIYSDLNGVPNTKLYESANLDCSTIGLKTATLSFTFNAGTRYWLALHSNGTPSIQTIPNTALLPIKTVNTNLTYTHYLQNVTFGLAPATWNSTNGSNTLVPLIGIVQV